MNYTTHYQTPSKPNNLNRLICLSSKKSKNLFHTALPSANLKCITMIYIQIKIRTTYVKTE